MRTVYASPALLLITAALLIGCASSSTTAERGAAPTEEVAEDHDPNRVDAEDFEGRAIARIEEMLRGQVAGVSVRSTASGLVIRIRGASSFRGNNDPLFIIDGMPINAPSGRALIGINPEDVQSIEVLKNASETAMYGSRGANGVVLITTKRPGPPPSDKG